MPAAIKRDRLPAGRARIRAAARRAASRLPPRRSGGDRQARQHQQRIGSRGRQRARRGAAGPELPQDARTRASSLSTNRANSRPPGIDRSSDSGRAPRATRRDCTIAATAASRRCRSALLTPGGATSERQFSSSTSTPCSRSVGASTRADARRSRSPSTRTVPASICGANSARPLIPTDTWPPRIADIDSPPPEKAM